MIRTQSLFSMKVDRIVIGTLKAHLTLVYPSLLKTSLWRKSINLKGLAYNLCLRNLKQYKTVPLTFENDCCITEPFQSNKAVQGLCPTCNIANLI